MHAIKTLLKESGKTIKIVSTETNIPYSTLNDLVNGRIEMDQMRFGHARKLCGYFDISLDEFAAIARSENEEMTIPGARIIARNKQYYLVPEGRTENEKTHVCVINEVTRKYIREFAAWRLEEVLEDEEAERWINSTS